MSYFGKKERAAQRRYRQFVFEGMGLGKRGELSTGEMGTDMGGGRGDGSREGDSRILGRGWFVEEVLGGGGANSPGAGAIEEETGGCGGVTGIHWEEVGSNERGDSRRRSEAGDQ